MAKRLEPQEPLATSPEAQEHEMIGLAMRLAAQQLRDGTATSPVITHFLKLGTEEAKLQQMLLKAKTEALESETNKDALLKDAIQAFTEYTGEGGPEDDEY